MGDAHNVTVLGDVADNFDALVVSDEQLLDNWVDEHGYSIRSMLTASIAKAFMRFAQGFVDVGRIGNGVFVEGGIKGVGKDVLRGLTIVGVAGAGYSRGARMLRMVQSGGMCVPTALTNATRLAGQRFFVTAEQLAHNAGVNVAQLAAQGTSATNFAKLANALQRMRVPMRYLGTGSGRSMQNVLSTVRANPGGVVTFGITHAKGGHRLYAIASRLGGLIIRDPESRFAIYRTVADIERVYGPVSSSTLPLTFIPNAVLTTVAGGAQTAGGAAGLASIAFQQVPVITTSARDNETAAQALAVHDAFTDGWAKNWTPQLPNARDRPPEHPPTRPHGTTPQGHTIRHHVVASGDSLSKIAQHYYGNMHKWPVIYAANVKAVGKDPNRIKPGLHLAIPPLPTLKKAPQQAAKPAHPKHPKH